jgi:formyltetrahydrofolate hydrolase
MCLLISCADRHGIVAAVSSFLFEEWAKITVSDRHTTDPEGRFFMRMESPLERFDDVAGFERRFAERVAGPLALERRLALADRPKRVAIMASREDHCLLDLLWRRRRGELDRRAHRARACRPVALEDRVLVDGNKTIVSRGRPSAEQRRPPSPGSSPRRRLSRGARAAG